MTEDGLRLIYRFVEHPWTGQVLTGQVLIGVFGAALVCYCAWDIFKRWAEAWLMRLADQLVPR